MKFIRTTLSNGDDELVFLDSCDEIAKVNYYDDDIIISSFLIMKLAIAVLFGR